MCKPNIQPARREDEKKRKEQGREEIVKLDSYKRAVIETYREKRSQKEKTQRHANRAEEGLEERKKQAALLPLFHYTDGIRVRISANCVEVCTTRGLQPFAFNASKHEWDGMLSFLASHAKGPCEVEA